MGNDLPDISSKPLESTAPPHYFALEIPKSRSANAQTLRRSSCHESMQHSSTRSLPCTFKRNSSEWDKIAASLGYQPRKFIDKETEAAMSKRLSQPRQRTAPASRPCPQKLVYVRDRNSGRLEPVKIPLPLRSESEQIEYMSAMYDNAQLAKQKRDFKLAQKYLQPLAPPRKLITDLDELIDHLIALDKLYHGVTSQAASIRRGI